MNRTMKTSDQNGAEISAALLADLTKLTWDQPTTPELEEALALVPALTKCLRDWVCSRHLIETANRRRVALGPGQLALRAIATCTPEEDAAFEAMAARQINPIFGQLLAPMRGAM